MTTKKKARSLPSLKMVKAPNLMMMWLKKPILKAIFRIRKRISRLTKRNLWLFHLNGAGIMQKAEPTPQAAPNNQVGEMKRNNNLTMRKEKTAGRR